MPVHPLPQKLPFGLSEYESRMARARAAMVDRGIDLLIAADPSNMAWLTGYDGWSFYTPQAVALAATGEPVWWGRNMDEPGARRTCWMDHGNIAGFSDIYVMNPPLHAFQDLAELVARRGWGNVTIGVEMDNYYYSAAAHNALTRSLPDANFVDATGLANRCRAVKSLAEIAFMRRAATIIEKMYDHIYWRTWNRVCARTIWLPAFMKRRSGALRNTAAIMQRLHRWYRPAPMPRPRT